MTAVLSDLDSLADISGSAVPRLFTPPKVVGRPGPCGCGCAHDHGTTLGFQAIAFSEDVLGIELLGWQKWWLIHALELNPDGSFRFSTILTLVARQNGKTTLLKVVSLWFLYLKHGFLVLGVAQDLKIARESWQGAVQLAENTPALEPEIVDVRRTNGEQCLTIAGYRRYMISAATRSAGRGLSVDLLIMDELREQRTTEAWAALANTTMARSNALIVGISNQGDDQSVVLNALRAAALAGSDPDLMLCEWSAPDGCDPDDPHAIAQANPGLGKTITWAKLRTMRATSSITDWRTENLCQRVAALDQAIDPHAWGLCKDGGLDLAPWRPRLTYCVDVAPDGYTVLGACAPLDDGRLLGQVVKSWDRVVDARREIGNRFQVHRPRAVGWYPGGPGEQIGAELRALDTADVLGIRQMTATGLERTEAGPGLVDLSGRDYPAICEGFATVVEARLLRHPGDPLLDAHVAAAEWKDQGDGRRFARRGVGRVSGLYAVAGAVELARRLPIPAARVKARIF